jgi:hypothetical protein
VSPPDERSGPSSPTGTAASPLNSSSSVRATTDSGERHADAVARARQDRQAHRDHLGQLRIARQAALEVHEFELARQLAREIDDAYVAAGARRLDDPVIKRYRRSA